MQDRDLRRVETAANARTLAIVGTKMRLIEAALTDRIVSDDGSRNLPLPSPPVARNRAERRRATKRGGGFAGRGQKYRSDRRSAP